MSEATRLETEASQEVAPRKSSPLFKILALLFLVSVVGVECIVAYVLLSRSSSGVVAAETAPAKEESEKSNHGAKEGEKKEKKEAGKTSEKEKNGEKEKPAKSEAKEDKDGKKGVESKSGEEELDGEQPDQVEIDLEQFSVTSHVPASNATMRIDFHLYGIIASGDKEEFNRLMKVNQHRFREQVLVTVRSAEGNDLADAGLGLLKRQILEKTNLLLGKPYIKAVIVSDFSYLEQ
jgi:flagellar FliL protein